MFIGERHYDSSRNIKRITWEHAVFAEMTEHNPRPSELAFLGRDLPGEDVHTFVPNYIRLAEAEAKWLEAQKGLNK